MLPYCSSGNYCSSNSATMLGCKGTHTCRCFYDLMEQQFHHIELPQGLNKTCRGSAFGWMFMMDRTPSLLLLNPLTRSTIPLPPITSFPDVLGFFPDKVGKEYLYLDKDGLRIAKGKKEIEHNYIHRVALSAEPTSEECVLMVIRSPTDRTLAFCRPTTATIDNQKWTLAPNGSGSDGDLSKLICFEDVVYWKGQFYALVNGGRVFVCDLSSPNCPRLSLFLDVHRSCRIKSINNYLLISPTDELMMVTRNVSLHGDSRNRDGGSIHQNRYDSVDGDEDFSDDTEWTDDDGDDSDEDNDLPADESDREVDHYGMDSESDDNDNDGHPIREIQLLTDDFRVFKMRGDRKGWDEVESIGDFALFLGYSSATCISTRDHPELAPNSIYFTDDMTEKHCKRRLAGADMGVYDLTTRNFTPFYCTTSVHNNPSFIWPLPVWVLPSNF
ncbi:unnamed protein product [Linum tenue]|nr:unnamed protein product [Linum tenue]